jgi:hypothetical protein
MQLPVAVTGTVASADDKASSSRNATCPACRAMTPKHVIETTINQCAMTRFRFSNELRQPPPSTCQNPEAPTRVAQTRPRMTALQHQPLLPRTKVFRNQQPSGPEDCRNGQYQKLETCTRPPYFQQVRLPGDFDEPHAL